MPTLQLTGTINAANGEVLIIILYDSNDNPVWPNPLSPTGDFDSSFDIPSGSYTLNIVGATQGQFTFNVQGVITINPSVPVIYNKKISNSFDITL